MKRIFALLLAALLLTGCAATKQPQQQQTVYEASFLTLFDTVTVVKGTAESQEAFGEVAQTVHDELEHYHQLFDVYNTYEGMNNLKTVNDQAGIAPVTVDAAIIDLLKDCRSAYRYGLHRH